ncbi:MAG: hypothetical protein WCJ95_21645 [Mariniphaga sp.]
MRTHVMLFVTGFAQVFLVSANTYFISTTTWAGIAVCGFGVSYLWTINVRRVTIGTRSEQIIYAAGAMMGGLIGVASAKMIRR